MKITWGRFKPHGWEDSTTLPTCIERMIPDARRLLFQAIEDSNRQILRDFANLPDVKQRTVWREDYFRSLLVERNIPVIAVIEYFSGQNGRLLNLDISHCGLPVCQDTVQ